MIELSGIRLLVMSILVLYLGVFVTRRVSFLERYNIPPPVTGGVIFSLGAALLVAATEYRVEFDLRLRDFFLLCFFATVGLSARIRLLLDGGKVFLILVGVTAVFLVAQNTSGILAAYAVGLPPAYGLLAGSISFAGGHGTAITWGTLAEEAGLSGALEFGLAAATLGLIAGGAIGGPIAQRLIRKNALSGDLARVSYTPGAEHAGKGAPVTMDGMINTMLLIAISIGAGVQIHEALGSAGTVLPQFLPVMFTGVVLTNLTDVFRIQVKADAMSLWSDVSLQIFLAMSLMSMDLLSLRGTLGPILVILLVQVANMAAFAYFVVFKMAGRDYEASVMAAGFAGLGLGATPVGIANMNAITHRFGASPKAFLVVPLIGAFLLDLLNAAIIRGFLRLPIFQQ